MSLLSEVEALVNGEQLCVVGKWEAKLPERLAAELDEVLDSTLPLTAVHAALGNRDGRVPFSSVTFTRHFAPARGGRRRCGCRS